MPLVLPAAWPDPRPEGLVDPGTVHQDTDAQAIVEAHNYVMAHNWRSHVSQSWAAGQVQSVAIGAPGTRLLVYLIIPRLAAVNGLVARFRADGGPNGGTVQIACVDTGATVNTVVAAGTGYYTATLALNRPELLTVIEVYGWTIAGGLPYVDILALQLRDNDLTAATLP